jgi:hypothetical protein
MHASRYWEIHERLGREFRYDETAGAYAGSDGFWLLPGAEVSIAERCDLIVLAGVGQLAAFDTALAKPATQGYRPSFDEAITACRAVGAFVIGAHMYRPGKELAKIGRAKLAELDALELNGRDFASDERVREAARRLSLPLVGGSDAHFWAQVGIKATVLPLTEITQASLHAAIRGGRSSVESQSYGPIAVRISRAYKRIRKMRAARGALTGAYGEGATLAAGFPEAAGRIP